ncbi:MFS transporter-like protein [Xylaria nigripes]|nr:MFS transporter-like protein [Xylaria nigripes]
MARFRYAQQFLSGSVDASDRPPYFLSLRSSTTLIVIAVNLAVFTDIFFYGLAIPVIPFALSSRVGVPEDQVQYWVSILLAAYSAALFIGSPIAGIYADQTSSRRWPLLLGLLALAGASFLLAFSHSVGLFVLGRVLQGLSAAVVWSVGCALLVDTMGTAVGVAMGYVNISMSLGLLLAPVIGGVVYNEVGYLGVYYVAFGVVGLDIVLRLFMIEKKVARQWIDQSETEDIGAVETGISTEMPNGELPRNPTPKVGADHHRDHANASETGHQKRGARHVVTLLKSGRLFAAMYGIFVESGILLGFDAVLALFVRGLFRWNSTAVAILFLALFLPGFTAPLSGWVSDRYGAKWPSFAGFVFSVPVLISLRFVTENTIQDKILLAFLLALAGFALSLTGTSLMAEISYCIEAHEAENPGIFGEKGVYGLAYGLFNMAFALGGIIGPIWAGYVVKSAGWGTLGWSFGLWCASAAAIVLIFGANKPREPMEDVDTEST